MPNTHEQVPKLGVTREIYEQLRVEAKQVGASIRNLARWKLMQPFSPAMLPTIDKNQHQS